MRLLSPKAVGNSCMDIVYNFALRGHKLVAIYGSPDAPEMAWILKYYMESIADGSVVVPSHHYFKVSPAYRKPTITVVFPIPGSTLEQLLRNVDSVRRNGRPNDFHIVCDPDEVISYPDRFPTCMGVISLGSYQEFIEKDISKRF